jgi:2-(1,2-epoxy-1,2-dihydrophenyl)acetyl-CoA isomerase
VTADGVRFEQDGHLGRITLARPAAANAFDLATAEAFGHAVTASADASVRAVLLRGEGRRFCAGGDVAAMAASGDPPALLHELATVLEKHLRRMSELQKPVVAAVHGAVAGAGLAFVLNADITIAARSTKFVMAYAGIGLTPDCGVSYLLPRAVGQQRALELALTRRVLSAPEAKSWGLITEVVDDDTLAQRADELVSALLGESTFALGRAKRLIRQSWDIDRQTNATHEADTIRKAASTPEAVSRIEAFTADQESPSSLRG